MESYGLFIHYIISGTFRQIKNIIIYYLYRSSFPVRNVRLGYRYKLPTVGPTDRMTVISTVFNARICEVLMLYKYISILSIVYIKL